MAPRRQRILWVDDEIDRLRPHILYLEAKGYRVIPVSNGGDALALLEREPFDLVLLDEMMPGMGGLEVLGALTERHPGLPVVMITKSEEENLMNEALGRRISDYLIKPVNPSQIFLACKKIFEARALEHGTAVRAYVDELRRGRDLPLDALTWPEWVEAYLRAVRWEMEIHDLEEAQLAEAHQAHLGEMNRHFARFIARRYPEWIAGDRSERPLLCDAVVPERIVPLLRAGRKAALIVIDCLRLDQWLALESLLPAEAGVTLETSCSLLPTATPYARNAIFSGLRPAAIAQRYPEFWHEAQHDETGKNRFERELLAGLLERCGMGRRRFHYVKVVTRTDAEEFQRRVGSFADSDLVALVFTFVDTFTHGRSRDAILAEFAQDARAMRSHIRAWFEHSVVRDAVRAMIQQGRVTLVTTDHGNLQVRRPAPVGADRRASPGTRCKVGPALNCDPEHAVRVTEPTRFGLPAGGVVKTYLFAVEDYFFVYPRDRHAHERVLTGSFQHGGISLEEMVLPLATLTPPTG